MATKPVRTTVETIAESVQEYIGEHGLGVGDLLPSIEKMAKLFSVSNSTMREALQYLAAAGIVSIQQGRGTFVSQPCANELLASPAWRMLAGSMKPEELKDALIAIEAGLGRLAAKRISLSEVGELSDLLNLLEHALEKADYTSYANLENQFRDLLGRVAGNRLLAELAKGLWHLPLFATEETGSFRLASHSFSYYRKLYEALIVGDAEEASRLSVKYIKGLDSFEPQKDLIIYYDVLGTGSFGGSFYTLGQGIAKLIGDNTQIKLDISVTGGGIENVKLAQDKKLAIGITQADVARDAFQGVGSFNFPHHNIRLIGCLPGLELQISTLASRGITRLQDLKNRPLAVGAHGGASADVARGVLEEAGLHWGTDYDPKIVSFSTSVDMLCDGTVDAVFFLSVGQSPALLELSLKCPIRLIELEDGLIASLEARHPYWYKGFIETNTYPNQDRRVQTIGVPTILITHKDLSVEDAYIMTSSIYMHASEIQTFIWPPRCFRLQDAAREVGIPYHPGAERFFRRYKIAT